MSLDSFKELLLNYKQEKDRFISKAKLHFKNVVAKLFNEHITLQTITWTQYTPYFMDGDPCVFTVNTLYFSSYDADHIHNIIDESSYDPTRWVIADYGSCNEHMLTPKAIDDFTEFSSIMQSSEMEEVLESLFGDHTRVVCTREEIKNIEYQHD